MKNIINELWHGNIIPQEDSRTNLPEMKELLGYMAQNHEDLEKSIIARRYYNGKTQMEIADEIGISQAQVSRIEKGAIDKLRRYMQ